MRFNSVAEGMAQIQQRALAVFMFVGRHHVRLKLAAAANAPGGRLFIQRQQRIEILLQPAKELAVQNNAVFDHFRQA